MPGKQLRVLAIGAHPDDCEYCFAGTAANYRALGHAVKFVSVTNGNAGHQTLSRTELAARRAAETRAVSQMTGIEYEILPNDDGALLPGLQQREQIIALIRAWQPDLVFTHRPFDYHADHRATGQLVQDASYLLGVPAVCPAVPALRYMPVILSFHDTFTRPVPFRADIAVCIDDVFSEKIGMLDCHRSQFYDWLPWVEREEDGLPQDEPARFRWLESKIASKDCAIAQSCRETLIRRYGTERGAGVRCAEAFEVSEYGAPLTEEQEKAFFPF